ncbi:hypothetical protein POUND7_006863 [Theobroma cacao]
MDWKLYSQQRHHYLYYSLMAILYDNNCIACSSFTFSSQKVRRDLTILNLSIVKFYSQQHHHYLCNKGYTTCNSFTFSYQEVILDLTILNSRRDANDLPGNSLPAIFEMQLVVNGVNQRLLSSGLSGWEKCLES